MQQHQSVKIIDPEAKASTSAPGPEIALVDHSRSHTIEGLKRPSNADEALKAFESDEEIFEIDEATNKGLPRKIDLHLLPVSIIISLQDNADSQQLLFLVYSLQFLNKLTLSYASVMGLKKDLHMCGSQYS